jgi:hypothetical protein
VNNAWHVNIKEKKEEKVIKLKTKMYNIQAENEEDKMIKKAKMYNK